MSFTTVQKPIMNGYFTRFARVDLRSSTGLPAICRAGLLESLNRQREAIDHRA
jgi:hypothetical protein